MKGIHSFFLITSLLVFSLICFGSAIAFGPKLPGGPVGPKPPVGKGAPVGPIIVIDQVTNKVCLIRSANTFRRCVNACPKLDMQSEKPDIKGVECMLKCIEIFASSISKCP